MTFNASNVITVSPHYFKMFRSFSLAHSLSVRVIGSWCFSAFWANDSSTGLTDSRSLVPYQLYKKHHHASKWGCEELESWIVRVFWQVSWRVPPISDVLRFGIILISYHQISYNAVYGIHFQILTRAEDPLKYWVARKTLYPTLRRPACKYLCISASCVPCERIFSKAGELVSQKRSRLKPKTVEMILFLTKNLWMLLITSSYMNHYQHIIA